MMNKKIIALSLALTGLILIGCILNLHALILAVVAVLCLRFLFLDTREATFLLFFFSPLSYILVYKQYNIYIFLIVAYIVGALLKKKNAIAVIPALFLLLYCVVFSDSQISINLGKFISLILLFGLLFVCQYAERRDYKYLVRYFLLGFIVSIVIALFKEQIPLLGSIFEVNDLYIDGVETSMDIHRFSGLSYDPNFFALIDCVLVSALLFGEKKLGLLNGIALIILVVAGFFTFSKSYVLLLAIIFAWYILTRNKAPLRTLLFIMGAVACLGLIEIVFDFKVISLVVARFTVADSANDLTTGRLELWIEYLDYIINDVKCLLFGEGFNALSLRKAAHNTYIEFVYHFGLVGIGLWITYFAWCKKEVAKRGDKKTSSGITMIILLLGIFFLNSFQFQQLWCCIFFALISPYLDGGQNEKTEHNSTNI